MDININHKWPYLSKHSKKKKPVTLGGFLFWNIKYTNVEVCKTLLQTGN